MKGVRTEKPTFDADGYPTDETLETIATWDDFSSDGYREWIEYVKLAWYWNDLVFVGESENLMIRQINEMLKRGYKVTKLSTGGWSGNESIIRAMKKNVFWMTKFLNHRAGGHYELRLHA